MGKPIIMGRLTHESIGRPLPGRQNIVITRQADFSAEGCDVVSCLADALTVAGDVDEVMVIGGGDIYRQFLRRAHRIYRTRIETEIEGDTFFPEIAPEEWTVVDKEAFAASDEREWEFVCEVLERRQD